MNTTNIPSTKSFAAHMCKYLGVGLISGSIVHAGTLGGGYFKYIVLIIAGVALFVIGNVLEHGLSSLKQLLPYIGISTILSIGTGMVSGGTQHYLDGPAIAAILFPIGFFLAYLSFIYRDYSKEFTFKKVLSTLATSLVLFLVLTYIAKQLPESTGHTQAEKEIINGELPPQQVDGHSHYH
jgi:hypothetical protein